MLVSNIFCIMAYNRMANMLFPQFWFTLPSLSSHSLFQITLDMQISSISVWITLLFYSCFIFISLPNFFLFHFVLDLVLSCWKYNASVSCGDCFPFICYVYPYRGLLPLAFYFAKVLFTSVIFKIIIVGPFVHSLTRSHDVQAAEALNFRVFLFPYCPCLPLSNSLHFVVFYIIYEGSWTSYRKTFQMVFQPSYLEENSRSQEHVDCAHNNIAPRILYLCCPSSWSITFWNLFEYRNECIWYPHLVSPHLVSRGRCKLLLHYSLLSGFLFSSRRNGLSRFHDP